MFNQLLFILMASAANGWAQPLVRPLVCDNLLAVTTAVDLIAFDRIVAIEPDQDQSRGLFDGHPVFLKQLSPSKAERSGYLSMLDLVAQTLDVVGVGPRYFGMTFDPAARRYVQIFGYLRGSVIYAVDERIAPGAVITPRTVEDVRLAFEVLSELRILAEDAQFMLTADGRAVMIDYDEFQPEAHGREARRGNDQKLGWLESLFARHAIPSAAM